MASIRSQIADAMVTRIATLSPTFIKTVSFDTVRLLATDFQEIELPAVQLIDLGEVSEPEQLRAKKTWQISIEIVIGPSAAMNYEPIQKDLWDLMERVENVLGPKPNFEIPQVLHGLLLGSSTDLHLIKPLYTARIDYSVIYYQHVGGDC